MVAYSFLKKKNVIFHIHYSQKLGLKPDPSRYRSTLSLYISDLSFNPLYGIMKLVKYGRFIVIKLVACDLDGTLFNSNMEVSEENVRAIHKAQKKVE